MNKILMLLFQRGAFVLVSGNLMTFHVVARGVDHSEGDAPLSL
jgi:hypothetical protein